MLYCILYMLYISIFMIYYKYVYYFYYFSKLKETSAPFFKNIFSIVLPNMQKKKKKIKISLLKKCLRYFFYLKLCCFSKKIPSILCCLSILNFVFLHYPHDNCDQFYLFFNLREIDTLYANSLQDF